MAAPRYSGLVSRCVVCILAFSFICFMASVAIAKGTPDGSSGPKGSLVPGTVKMTATVAGTGITLDGSLGPSGPVGPGTVDGVSTTYLITDTLGKKAGGNLFFSFNTFNIYTGESATFTSPGNDFYSNIICRVTGGSPSSIDGLLRSTIDGANLFLLNPNGVMFGPNASLDVKGSFHVSTADYLKFGDGSVFYSNLNLSSVLSTAQPQAFGFLNGNPAGISGNGAFLQVPDGNTLSIIGGDITFNGNPQAPGYVLSAPEGRINLVSVASPGEVNLDATDLGISSFSKLGTLSFLEFASINVMGADPTVYPAGSVMIRGGNILLKSEIDAAGAPPGSVDIKGGSLILDGSFINVVNAGGTDPAQPVLKVALTGDLVMKNESIIDSSAAFGGRGGDIQIVVAGSARFGDDAPGTGYGSSFGFYGTLQSNAYATGRSGDIYITAGELTVQNGFGIGTAATADQLWTGANYGGDAGNITVRANSINLLDKGNIYSNGFGYGRGGVIDIAAHDVLISAANEAAVTNLQTVSGVAAQTDNFSNGGLIKLQADNLKILDGGQISTVLLGGGRGADADIQAKNILISGYVLDPILGYSLSGIDARLAVITHLDGSLSTPTGVGGNINVTTDNLQITNGGAVRTNLFDGASGTAGDINISAGGINISSGGQIYADSFRGTGDSGNINITANTLGIAGFGNSQAPFPIPEFTGLSTTTNAGRGGTINLSLTGDLSVDSGGGINAETQGSGLGGAISIAAQNINLTNGSSISAASYGTGNAGNIDFKVGNTFTARNSTVSTQAVESDGGDIVLTAGYMARLIDSKITTSVNGGPQTVGGNITVDPDFVILQGSSIVANAFQGKGGNIRIAADTYLADPVSVVSASSALGIDGTVDISAPISDISAVVQPLPKEFVSATELLREPCEVRARGGKSSSLVLKGRDGVPNEPGGFLPSPMN